VSGFPNLPAGVDPALGVEPTITVSAGAVPLALATVDLVVGHGVVADEYDTVTANYLGVNYVDCAEFGSTWSVDQVGTYALQDVIPGFRQGIVGMAVGGRREIIVPSWLGYSVLGERKVAPNEELVFVVDVLAISPPGVRSSSP
jgi:peptidylprolyl isomerase